MFKSLKQNTRNRQHYSVTGKNFCWSIPAHKLDILDDLAHNAMMEMCSSQSQYLIRLVDRDTKLKKKQMEETASIAQLFGEK